MSIVPSMHVMVRPATHTLSPSTEMCTRPDRPSTVPWRATYGGGQPAGADQPLGDRGVEAAGHRVLDQRAVLGEEGAHLDGVRRAGRVRADEPDVAIDEPGVGRPAPRRRSPAARRSSRVRCRPTRRRRPRPGRGPMAFTSVGDELVVDRSRPQQRRRGERQTGHPSGAADQAGRALLHDRRRAARGVPPCGQPGVAGAEGRVPGEGQLRRRREDPDPVVGVRGRRRRARTSSRRGSSSGRRLASSSSVESIAVEDDGDRVAERTPGRRTRRPAGTVGACRRVCQARADTRDRSPSRRYGQTRRDDTPGRPMRIGLVCPYSLTVPGRRAGPGARPGTRAAPAGPRGPGARAVRRPAARGVRHAARQQPADGGQRLDRPAGARRLGRPAHDPGAQRRAVRRAPRARAVRARGRR